MITGHIRSPQSLVFCIGVEQSGLMRLPVFSCLSLLVLTMSACETALAPIHSGPSYQRSAEERALAYLSREVPRWSRENHCFSCHNNGDAARALYVASTRGYRISPEALADTTAWLQRPDRWENNKGDPAFSDKRLATIQFTAALATAIETRHVLDKNALLAAARKLLAEQNSDGAWHIEPASALGSPATYGTHLATVTGMKALAKVQDDRVATARRRAERWLCQSAANNVLNSAALLMALPGNEEPEAFAKRNECLSRIRQAQTRDGGWGPYADSPAEPFDTAVVLLALVGIRHEPDVESFIQRGRNYLRQTQLPDGSWPETTRPPRGESYAQRISTTAWATLALLQTRIES